MKTVVAILFLAFSSSLCHAQQPFAPTGAIWNYNYSFPPPSMDYGFVRITYTGDSTVSGILCKQLEAVDYNYSSGVLVSVYTHNKVNIYQNGDTIFWYVNGGFLTLFNFGLLASDQWVVDNTQTGLNCDSLSVIQVVLTSSVTTNGQLLKVITVDTVGQSPYGFHGDIRERIGPVGASYLFPINQQCDTNVILDLIQYSFVCYQDSSFGAFPNPLACQLPVGINETVQHPFTLYPNPSSGSLCIETGNKTGTGEITVFDLPGKKMFSKCINGNKINIDFDLPEGIYFVQICFASKLSFQKLLIQK